MEKTRSEDTLIFNGLTPRITKMKPVYNALKVFCENKKLNDPSDRFNIILFEENGPNYLNDFTLNPEHILIAQKSFESMLVRANIGGGIMVAITFIIDVFKRISEKCFRLIIFTDSGSLKIPEQYIPVLENLIDKVKDFPFILDVIRVSIDDPKEDLKLMKLARRCGGDIHEIKDIRALHATLEFLLPKKEITSTSFLDDNDFDAYIENQPFFENLAEEPIKVEKKETCSICFQKDNKDLVQCTRCETVTHKTCWAQWAKNSNIGLIHVFRCHNCYNLIKLDEEFVFAVHSGKEPAVEEVKVKILDIQQYLESLETDEGPKIIQVEDPMAISDDEYEDLVIEFEDIESEDDFIVEFDEEQEELAEYQPLSEDELKIVWCNNCGCVTTNEWRVCPKCKFPFNKE